MRRVVSLLLIGSIAVFIAFSQSKNKYILLRKKEFENKSFYKCLVKEDSYQSKKKEILDRLDNKPAGRWGEFVKGVNTRFVTEHKIVAFTFDACGGWRKDGYDKELIDFLIAEKIPATLFVTGLWIDGNYQTFVELSKNPLFEIENHGYVHQPCSMNGECKYGIRGTQNAAEAYDEIEANEEKIKEISGRRPLFYRSATAYIDEASVHLANLMGVSVVSFDVLSGDAVATEKVEVIKENVLKGVRPGSIIIMHFNHPEGHTYEALKLIIPQLRKEGYSFGLLKDFQLRGK